jgi:hypothetical protein
VLKVSSLGCADGCESPSRLLLIFDRSITPSVRRAAAFGSNDGSPFGPGLLPSPGFGECECFVDLGELECHGLILTVEPLNPWKSRLGVSVRILARMCAS